jgi:hypothetical protein
MWPEYPNQQLRIVKQHQSELRAVAAGLRHRPSRTAGSRTYRFWGVRLHVGSFLLVAGRSLRDDDARLAHSTH